MRYFISVVVLLCSFVAFGSESHSGGRYPHPQPYNFPYYGRLPWYYYPPRVTFYASTTPVNYYPQVQRVWVPAVLATRYNSYGQAYTVVIQEGYYREVIVNQPVIIEPRSQFNFWIRF